MQNRNEPRLLFVEDNEEDYLLTARLLRNTPFQITWMQSVKDALIDVKRLKFDAILLDLDLLDSFGLDTLEQIQRRIFDTPIVILTGHESDERALQALQRGAQDYLVKDRITADGLLRSIRYAIERHRLDQRLRWIIRKLVWLNEQVIHTKDQALEELRRTKDLMVTVSHEIRTPLAAVIGISELLVQEDLDHESKTLADKLFDAAKRLAMAVTNILDLSNLTVKRSEPDIKECSVRAVVQDVLEIIRPIAEGKGVSLGLRVSDEVPETIKSDAIRLQQAILTFTHTAVDCIESGSVSVEASMIENAENMIQIAIVQGGLTIRSDITAPVLYPDQTFNSEPRDPELGLSIATKSIEMLGGSVGFSTESGQRTKFWLTVPI